MCFPLTQRVSPFVNAGGSSLQVSAEIRPIPGVTTNLSTNAATVNYTSRQEIQIIQVGRMSSASSRAGMHLVLSMLMCTYVCAIDRSRLLCGGRFSWCQLAGQCQGPSFSGGGLPCQVSCASPPLRSKRTASAPKVGLIHLG
jgi:hypothetical protein